MGGFTGLAEARRPMACVSSSAMAYGFCPIEKRVAWERKYFYVLFFIQHDGSKASQLSNEEYYLIHGICEIEIL